MSLRIAPAAFAHPHAPMGYGVVGAKLHEALRRAGATLVERGFDWDCVTVVTLPVAWPFPGGKARPDIVWHTMFECEPLPADWPAILNRCGLVWSPSAWCTELFRANGVTRPIMTAGYGVDRTLFCPVVRATDRPRRFLIWGAALVGRKNVLLAIRAFLAAGLPPGEAELIIKVNAGMADEVVKLDGQIVPNVRVIAADWRYPSQIADLCRSVDVGINLSAGEGFGLMPLEMMATGLPVICHNVTGMQEYLTPANALLVESVGRERAAEYEVRFGGQYWQAQPDFAQAVAWIRFAFENPGAVAQIGAQAAADVAQNWTWEQAGQRALAQLTAHYG